jgi:hypothetical protein
MKWISWLLVVAMTSCRQGGDDGAQGWAPGGGGGAEA